MNEYADCEKFCNWLTSQVVADARGDYVHELPENESPRGKFWLGRLACEESVALLQFGDRGERLDPCAIGFRLKAKERSTHSVEYESRFCIWSKHEEYWQKSETILVQGSFELSVSPGISEIDRDKFRERILEEAGVRGFEAEVRVEVQSPKDSYCDVLIQLVNVSALDESLFDTNLYECSLSVSGVDSAKFVLESLPDSFRYDRNISAYGLNCGVAVEENGWLLTVDAPNHQSKRPEFYQYFETPEHLSFYRTEENPVEICKLLVEKIQQWGQSNWSTENLERLSDIKEWSPDMMEQAKQEAGQFEEEVARMVRGMEALQQDEMLLQAFVLMNRSIRHATAGSRQTSWRPFQLGFILANIETINANAPEREIVDIVWFATGGGKTETYIGLILIAAFYDRLRGKAEGVTAWSRFPLRMLSLQQTQRFANSLAAAELVRLEARIEGAPFSLGFLVGDSSTPNRIKPEPDPSRNEPDAEDEQMPPKYRLLDNCPFCHQGSLEMNFDKVLWCLEHRCKNETCTFFDEPLPIYIVDEEIYRFLPTVVVGTLDKAASISMQAAMKGLVSAPRGRCSVSGHGFTYAPRSDKPSGCLVPGCRGSREEVSMAPELFGPTFRLQDELHLIRDSLGAVNAHYEAIFDYLQKEYTGLLPKILGSSATLSGFEKQADVLYRREARVFPVQGPIANEGFWVGDGPQDMRKFVALAPRGVTMEFAVDSILTSLQHAIRRLVAEPDNVCLESGIDEENVDLLISLYGTDTVYGNNIKDLDAVTRSSNQILVEGPVEHASLTGRTPMTEVRETLARLKEPEEHFQDRLHIITASSMMSHGVDIDRLNVMVMMGIPLTTAELIQTTARVGRAWPGLVFVFHRMARERDAGVFRNFDKFIEQGDRFVEPIPVTRRSRRVLERTLPGIELARILCQYEPKSTTALTTVRNLREYFKSQGISMEQEREEIVRLLALSDGSDDLLIQEIEQILSGFFENLFDPAGTFRFPSELFLQRPMLSLRDVEEQTPIIGNRLS